MIAALFLRIASHATAEVGKVASCRSIFRRHLFGEAPRGGQQNRRRFRVVFRLRQHVGGDMRGDRRRRR